VAADPVLFERVKGLLAKELADLREEGRNTGSSTCERKGEAEEQAAKKCSRAEGERAA